ncbi:MAG TPA: DoxX family protein [Chloroflexia bacterium]|nr:DoxX family protein [Chloroflexia bacterium]
MKNVALLLLRGTAGVLLAGHGAQKLFGWFGGPGLEGTTGWLGSLGFRPPRAWALMAAIGEFGGGVLTALGFLNPLGPLGIIGAMIMATGKAHWGKPIWASAGGPELPITNLSIAGAVALAGPGAYSLDYLLGLKLPRWTLLPGLVGTLGVIAYGLYSTRPEAQAPAEAAEETTADQDVQFADQPAAVPASPEAADAPVATGAITEPLSDDAFVAGA